MLKHKFKKLHPTMVKSGLPAIVIDFLFQEDVISDEQLQMLQRFKDDPQQRCRELLALLHTSGNPQAFVHLYMAIKKESALKWLIEEIDKFTDQSLIDLLQQRYTNDPTGELIARVLNKVGLCFGRLELKKINEKRYWNFANVVCHIKMIGNCCRYRGNAVHQRVNK